MIYEEFPPSADLARQIECWWRFRLEDGDPDIPDHIVMPDGTVRLAFERFADGGERVVMVGPSERVIVTPMRRGSLYGGARLYPGSGLLPPGLTLDSMRDRLIEADELADGFRGWCRDMLLGLVLDGPAAAEAVFRHGCLETPASDPIVAEAVARIVAVDGRVKVADLARDMGIGERRLHRRFAARVGFCPKVFARIRRVRHACILAQASGLTLAQAALASGYADQAHLARDVAACFANTPRAVVDYLRRIGHNLEVSADTISSETSKTAAAR